VLLARAWQNLFLDFGTLSLFPRRHRVTEAKRTDYFESRARMALGNKTQAEYLLQPDRSPLAQGKKAAES